MLARLSGKNTEVSYGDWRPADQKVFICDICKAKRDFGWEPAVTVEDGVARLYDWVVGNKYLFGDGA